MIHIKMAMDFERYQKSSKLWRWMVRQFGTELVAPDFPCRCYRFLGKDYVAP